MAMNEAQVLGLELESIDDRVETAFEQDGTFYAEIEKRPAEKTSTRDLRIPIKLKPGGRTGHFNPDGGDLGRGDGPTYDKAVINPVYIKHAVEITTKADWATDDRRKAVLSAARRAMVEEFDEFRAELDRYTQQAGDGVLATVSAQASSGGKDLLTFATAGDGFNTRLLRYGNYYGVFDATLATKRTWLGGTALNGEGQIDLFDPDNNQCRFNVTAGSAGVIATDKIVISGLNPTPVSIYGVPYHHTNSTSGTWLGFTRSSTPEVRANAVNAAGALALSQARLAVNKIYIRLGMKKKWNIEAWTHPCQADAYERIGQLNQSLYRTPGTSDPGLSLYFSDNMQLAGCRLRQHANWNKTRIDFIIKELWGRAEMHKPGFYEVDGRRVFEARSTDGGVAAALIFYFACAWNLYMANPAAGSYIYGLTVLSGY